MTTRFSGKRSTDQTVPQLPWSPDWDGWFRRERALLLLRSARIFLPGIVLFQLYNMLYALSYTDFRLHTAASQRYFVLYVLLFTVSLAALGAVELLVRRERYARVIGIQYLYTALFLAWSAAVTALDQRTSDQMYVYLMAILTVAVITTIPWRAAIPLFLGAQGLMIALLPVFQEAEVDNHGNIANSTIFCVIAILISGTRYTAARRSFSQQRLIEEQTRELQAKNAELSYAASHDSLTGLLDRRQMVPAAMEMAQAARDQRDTRMGVCMIDIDNFKRYNDVFGHIQGDECLRQVAQALSGQLSAGRLFRYGGEEFLFTAAGSEDFFTGLGEALRRAVKERGFPGTEGSVTVSVGVAWGPVPEDQEAWQSLLRAADRALYQAKAQGKDRAVSVEVGQPHADPRAQQTSVPEL